MNDASQIYNKIHKKYGMPFYGNTSISDEYSLDILSQQFIEYIKNIIVPVKKESCPGVDIKIDFIQNTQFNAFATKISTNQYYACIFTGVIIDLKKHFSKKTLLSRIRSSLTSIKELEDNDIVRFLLYFAVTYVAFHELGHIYRGHIDYLFAGKNYCIIDETKKLKITNSNDSSEKNRNLTESDADAFAGMIVAGSIIEQSKRMTQSHFFDSTPINTLMNDLLTLGNTAIYLVFCLFDQNYTKIRSEYPEPPIRAAIFKGHMGATLLNHGIKKDELLKNTINAIIIINNYVSETLITQKTTDLANRFSIWHEEYLDDARKLSLLLSEYTPCNR